jgi:UDP-N-acetylglucosamine 2-epimerase (non-hydrolysing)
LQIKLRILNEKPIETLLNFAKKSIEENVDTQENLIDLLETLKVLAETYQYPVIVSTHPRTKKRLEALDDHVDHPLIRFVKPFGLLDYIKLQMSAYCILSDSGTITEEASLLNLPAVTIRNAHERPEGMDVGTLIMSGLKAERVLESVKVVINQHQRDERVMQVVSDYQGGAVSKQVVRIVLSYTDYVNRTVWSQ